MKKRHIGIIGGGPAALFLFKKIAEAKPTDIEISIFEKSDKLGAGMPYSVYGANREHVTNVSGNEIPEIYKGALQWLRTCPPDVLNSYGIDPDTFTDYRVFPRLLFGQYLSDQFSSLLKEAKKQGLKSTIYFQTAVTDIRPSAKNGYTITSVKGEFSVDEVIICTGHIWPKKDVPTLNYFTSPYPPSKLGIRTNHSVALKGASLTAIDAIRTLARHNGKFRETNGKLTYETHEDSRDFKIVMHSRNGLLPAVRFHLDDPHLFRQPILTDEEMTAHRESNNDFISLDYVFEKNYKDLFKHQDEKFHNEIKDLSLEEFVDKMMDLREKLDPFTLLRAEYAEAETSIRRKESITWKELLAVLSFTMNPPAKYFSAEDMLRLQKVLMPLISIVIAFIPQSSCRELLALHDGGFLELVAVGDDNVMEPHPQTGATISYPDKNGNQVRKHYETFVDCTGQPHLPYEAFPFKGLMEPNLLYPATLRFSTADAAAEFSSKNDDKIIRLNNKVYMKVPGVAINDHFQAVDAYGATIDGLYIMAVPHLGGYNPDYSGLDFCDAASDKIIEVLV